MRAGYVALVRCRHTSKGKKVAHSQCFTSNMPVPSGPFSISLPSIKLQHAHCTPIAYYYALFSGPFNFHVLFIKRYNTGWFPRCFPSDDSYRVAFYGARCAAILICMRIAKSGQKVQNETLFITS